VVVGRGLIAAGLALSSVLPLARPVAAAAEITLDAHAQLQGHVRPGAWAEVVVHVTNTGPAVSGELRVRTQGTQGQGASQFGVSVELASGAIQDHFLYAKPPLFGSKLWVDLVVGSQALVTKEIPIKSHDAYAPIIGVVAEHPEGFMRDVTAAVAPNEQVGGQPTTVLTLDPADLPDRVEAWSAIDRLIWQDVDTTQLNTQQLDALRLWVAAGGRLVILGGTTGITTLSALPADLLPFQPVQTTTVAPADLASLIGSLPDAATDTPVLAGTFTRGSVMGRSGNFVYAAQAGYGQGQVTIIGVNPAEPWLARSEAAETLWHRVLPAASNAVVSPFQFADDSSLLYALQNLPAVALPPIEQIFLLLLAYIALIGPINYLVLRRLDRREWAWVTMPALVVVFAVGSYALGAALKGSDVIVNELSIVRAGQGTDQGRAQSYIGVYSPSRKVFTVQIANGALISETNSQLQTGQSGQPLDVLIGKTTSELRNFEVGFGVLRGFRAEAQASAPKIDASLGFKGGKVVGTITNNSPTALENVAVLFAGVVSVKPSLAAGETWQLSLDADPSNAFQFQLSETIFGSSFPRDPVEQRKLATRRAVVDQLSQYSSGIVGTPSDTPLLLGWQSTPALHVELAGDQPNRVGDSLFLVPLSMTYDAQTAFNDRLLVKTIIETKSDQAWFDGGSYTLSRGTMTVELRPAGLAGTFKSSGLQIALTQGNIINLAGGGPHITPLPDAQQPDQNDPVGEGVDGGNGGNGAVPPDAPGAGGGDTGNGGVAGGDPTDEPREEPAPMPFPGKPEPGTVDSNPELQLFDFSAGRWYEFPHFDTNNGYVIDNPERYVDPNGRVLLRLVNRNNEGAGNYFQIFARLEGTIEP
jgi:hypothetical protein